MRTKKTIAPFSVADGEKSLGLNEQSHVMSRAEPENALGLARRLCEIANKGQNLGLSPATAETLRHFCRVNQAAMWRPRFDVQHFEMLELHQLAERLATIIEACAGNMRFVLEEKQTFEARIDNNGQIERRPIAPLGSNQGLLERALNHPEIDWRRFARCGNEKCGAFYYKPRLSSRACGPRCENALRAREHYWLEVGRREVACSLRQKGKPLTEIARTLGLKPRRIRQYLTGGEHGR